VWRLRELGRKVMIEGGHVIAMEGWTHMFAWQVSRGMVTSTDLRQTGDGTFAAYDNLLKQDMTWTLLADGSIRANGAGGLFAPVFHLSPVELAFPDAFEEELAMIGGGGGIAPLPGPVPLPGPRPDRPAQRPGPINVDLAMTAPIVAGKGMCLDQSASQITKQGGRIQVWKCHKGPNQRFAYLSGDGLLVTASGMCLEASGTGNGAVVRAFGCDGKPAQRWKIKTVKGKMPGFIGGALPVRFVRFEHSSGKCLDVSKSQVKQNGGKVALWSCHGGSNQSWMMKK
jgi:hypothetical protein